jgi:hypothetical protein
MFIGTDLRKWQHLELDVLQRQAGARQHMADLVVRHRGGAVGGDDLALEVRDGLDLVFQVGPDQQLVADRGCDAVGGDGDGEILLERVEVAGGHAGFHDLDEVLRERHQGGGVHVGDLDVDAVALEVALLDRDHRRSCR